MRIAVVGLWHLGTVTAGCLASAGYDVTGIDEDAGLIGRLKLNQLPVDEPGLADLIQLQVGAGRLRYTTDFASAAGNELVWIAYDTPVDEDDNADVEFVIQRVERLFPHLDPGAIGLISSQMPVGSTARLEKLYRESGLGSGVSFAYSPENLRLGKAIEDFTKPDRVVVGVRSPADRERIGKVLAPFTNNVEWMRVESAEMTKHALNAFLATSVVFINEIATICEKVGADGTEVERGLKSDVRIGKRSYLHPGGPFAGGTLARDIEFLRQAAAREDVPVYMIDSVRRSNDEHKLWVRRVLAEALGCVEGKSIAVLGLTYKPGTNTLRRSTSVEMCHWIAGAGATVRAFDPAVASLPEDLAKLIELHPSAESAVAGADALVVATAWPAFKGIEVDVLSSMRTPIVIDPGCVLQDTLGADRTARYFGIGRPRLA